MMLIICDRNPQLSYRYLIEHTNKNFVFKSLLELAQLICSCGISSVYKPVKQGKELQKWIKGNRLWVYRFYDCLFFWCVCYVNAKPKTYCDLDRIRNDLFDSMIHVKRITYPKTAIWRYSKEYESEYPTNSELPIYECCEEYKKYIDWKFKKDEVR